MRNLIKKILKESDEWGWVDKISANPFVLDLSVVFFDKKLTEKEVGYIMDLIDDAGVYSTEERESVINSLVKYSPGGYIKSYINRDGVKRAGYGDTKGLFEDNKWRNILDSLEGKQYVEFNVTDVLPKTNITESDEFDWIRDVEDHPIPLTSIINTGTVYYCQKCERKVFHGLLKLIEKYYPTARWKGTILSAEDLPTPPFVTLRTIYFNSDEKLTWDVGYPKDPKYKIVNLNQYKELLKSI